MTRLYTSLIYTTKDFFMTALIVKMASSHMAYHRLQALYLLWHVFQL